MVLIFREYIKKAEIKEHMLLVVLVLAGVSTMVGIKVRRFFYGRLKS